jgi:hypothetical protein
VERFELLLVLCFVVVEDISNGGSWMPTAATLLVCGRIFFWEVRIVIFMHNIFDNFLSNSMCGMIVRVLYFCVACCQHVLCAGCPQPPHCWSAGASSSGRCALSLFLYVFKCLMNVVFLSVWHLVSNGGSWMPTAATLLVCGRIFFWEVGVGIIIMCGGGV